MRYQSFSHQDTGLEDVEDQGIPVKKKNGIWEKIGTLSGITAVAALLVAGVAKTPEAGAFVKNFAKNPAKMMKEMSGESDRLAVLQKDIWRSIDDFDSMVQQIEFGLKPEIQARLDAIDGGEDIPWDASGAFEQSITQAEGMCARIIANASGFAVDPTMLESAQQMHARLLGLRAQLDPPIKNRVDAVANND